MNKVLSFNQTIQNMKSNFISHETITCGDRNPSWIDETIQKLVLYEKCANNAYSRDKNNDDLFHKFKSLEAHLQATIEEKYYLHLSGKLLDNKTCPKYLSILNNKNIPCISPLLQNDKFIIDFKEKAKIFNDLFTKQCSLDNDSSKLPSVLLKNVEVTKQLSI